MQGLATYANLLFGILSIAAQILSIGIIAAFFSPRVRESAFGRFFSERAVLVAFVASLLATIGSLIYSDIIGYEPCKLCWFQRIFMYPQAVLMGMALWRRDAGIRLYGMVLSIIGAAIAAFHYIGQLGLNPLGLDCLAVGYSASCSKNFVLEFGYISIPLMALSAFLLMSLSLALSLRKEKTAAAL